MLQAMTQIIREAGQIILNAADDKDVHTKTSKHDLVTRYDAQVQEFLRGRLLRLVPDAGFFAEEDDGSTARLTGACFIVDPIDGTTNFIKGLRRSCISVALAQDAAIQYGVIYNPYTDEMFTAEAGKGADLNGEPIHVSACGMDEAIVCAGTSPYYPDCYDEMLRMSGLLMRQCMDTRRSGSAALELCDVACGRVEGYFEQLLSPWDFAAGALIVQQAGGIVTDMSGTALQFAEKSSVIAANPQCFDALVRLAEQARR